MRNTAPTIGERRHLDSQNHYTARLNPLILPNEFHLEGLCGEADHASYMSLLGGIAWVVNTRAEVAIFVGALNRVAKSPKYTDMKRLYTVLRFHKKHAAETLLKKLNGPLKVIAVSDSACKRQDESPLACRGSMTLLCTDTPHKFGGDAHVRDFDCKKQKRVTRSTFGARLLWTCRLHGSNPIDCVCTH